MSQKRGGGRRAVIEGATAAQIAASAERAVHAGAFAPGQALPAIRQLAAQLKVSPVTVAAAYRQLQARGLVLAGGRRGTRVRLLAPPAAPAAAATRIAEGLVDLASGNPDPALLPPFDTALRTMTPAQRMYGEPPVHPALAAFAAGEFAADGVASRRIAVVSGGLDGIERVLREHLRSDDRVAVEDPGAPALLDLLGASGYRVVSMAIDAEGPRPDAFEEVLAAGVRAVILTPRAQNPTGAALSIARARELSDLLRRRDDVLVIENDPVGPVAGVPALTICGAGHRRWAVVRSVSKFLGPDLRVALVAGDDLTIARVARRQALSHRWVSQLLQGLALALWSDPSSGRRLARAADLYTQRRQALIEALATHDIPVQARSGFNVWIPVREETRTVQALADRGWAVAAGERYRIRSGPAVRVTTSSLSVDSAGRFAADFAAAHRPSAAASA